MSAEIHYEGLVVRPDGFSWRDKSYSLDDITSLYWFRKNTTFRTNFAKTHTHYDARLKIFTRGDTTIQLKAHESDSIIAAVSERVFGSDYPSGPCLSLRKVYVVLAEKTFAQRLQGFAAQLMERENFHYGEVEFTQNGWVSDKRNRFEISKCSVNRHPFCVTFSEVDKSKTSFLRRMWSGPARIVVETTTDEDVFFALLQKLYGLKWGK